MNRTDKIRDSEAEKIPHSIDAEQSVLGGLMLNNDAWDRVSEVLSEHDFYTRAHRLIFAEMRSLIKAGSPIDLITLSESLENNGKLDLMGDSLMLPSFRKTLQVRLTSMPTLPLFGKVP